MGQLFLAFGNFLSKNAKFGAVNALFWCNLGAESGICPKFAVFVGKWQLLPHSLSCPQYC